MRWLSTLQKPVLVLAVAVLAWSGLAATALAHDEREVTFPDDPDALLHRGWARPAAVLTP